MTILLVILLGTFSSFELLDVLNNKIERNSSSTKWIDLSKADEFKPGKLGFDIGFGL